ncbi:MAG: hypothetical protein D6E12_09860 [Desulfovibrio sp.]|nr:MAG: hypothetical protein D6E12_09860 [Desulfovibrio sp.]
MPSMEFHADTNDLALIAERLNRDEDVAFVLPVGSGKFQACHEVDRLDSGLYSLWHIPGGAITRYTSVAADAPALGLRKLMGLKGKGMPQEAGPVDDPWAGWKNTHVLGDKTIPYLGDRPNIITLHVNFQDTGPVGISAFGWIGNRYRSEGLPAHPSTEAWWKGLRQWVNSNARGKVRAYAQGPEVLAFASAYARLAGG